MFLGCLSRERGKKPQSARSPLIGSRFAGRRASKASSSDLAECLPGGERREQTITHPSGEVFCKEGSTNKASEVNLVRSAQLSLLSGAFRWSASFEASTCDLARPAPGERTRRSRRLEH